MEAATQGHRSPVAARRLDPERYLRLQRGAVDRGADLGAATADRVRRGVSGELVFLGAGGAGILTEPAARLASQHSTFPVAVLHPAELVACRAPRIGPRTMVVIPSLSGTTKESLAAIEHARASGAWTAVLTAHGGSPLAQVADLVLVNEAADDTSSESFGLQTVLGVAGVLAATGDWPAAAGLPDLLREVPDALLAAKTAYEPAAEQVAQLIAASGAPIVTGAGYGWPAAHYYGMCILEEMQWIHARPVHAAHFFHGTLELVDEQTSIVILTGRDATRPVTGRVEAFVRERTDRVQVVDAAQVDLGAVPEEVAGVLDAVVLAALLEPVSAQLEVIRQHPLTTRRYYRRLEY